VGGMRRSAMPLAHTAESSEVVIPGCVSSCAFPKRSYVRPPLTDRKRGRAHYEIQVKTIAPVETAELRKMVQKLLTVG
jgi:hypothetical protein